MPSILSDIRTGLRAGWQPLLAFVAMQVALFVVLMVTDSMILDEAGKPTEGPAIISRFVWLVVVSSIGLSAGMFLTYCWFLARWLRAEFGLVPPLRPAVFLRQVVVQQLISVILASIASLLSGLVTMAVATGIVMSLFSIIGAAGGTVLFYINILIFIIYLLALIPPILCYFYVYLRYAPGLLPPDSTRKKLKLSYALAYSRENAAKSLVFRAAGKLTLFSLIFLPFAYSVNDIYLFGDIIGSYAALAAVILVPFATVLMVVRTLRSMSENQRESA